MTATPRTISGLDPQSTSTANNAGKSSASAGHSSSNTAPHGSHAPHGLSILDLDKRTYARALDCVHCGLCLPACPTYTENGLEADSPRGRIHLMKSLADGRIEPTDSVLEHLDLCLDCRACETACPSGVVYHELIEETREKLNVDRPKTFVDRMVESMFFHVFPHPTRLKLAMLPVRLMQKIGLWKFVTADAIRKRLPIKLDKMQQMLPNDATAPIWESNLATHYPAIGEKRATVGMFAGCVGSVLFQHVNRQTIAVLQRAGCDVVVPKTQQCCGAIHHHGGKMHDAMNMAIANISAFDFYKNPDGSHTGIDYIINNAAGCGAMLKDYDHLLRDHPQYAEKSKQFVAKNRDICELLVELDPPRPTHAVNRTVTYHDACHLAHAQKITAAPRQILSWIDGLTVIALPESDMCCGAAGTYNLSQPDMARDLATRKLNHIKTTGANTCLTANVGCSMQIQSEAHRIHMDLNVAHPISLLYEAYTGQTT